MAYFRKDNPTVKALRDVSIKQLEAAAGMLDALILRRCRHVVSENARTQEAATALVRAELTTPADVLKAAFAGRAVGRTQDAWRSHLRRLAAASD